MNVDKSDSPVGDVKEEKMEVEEEQATTEDDSWDGEKWWLTFHAALSETKLTRAWSNYQNFKLPSESIFKCLISFFLIMSLPDWFDD